MFYPRRGPVNFFLGLVVCLAPGLLRAQVAPLPGGLSRWNHTTLFTNELEMNKLNPGFYNSPDGPDKYCVVASRVVSLARDVIPGATVEVRPLLVGESRVLKTDASGIFQTIYFIKAAFARDFKVWLTVKKKGFQTAHELVSYSHIAKPVGAFVTLRPEEPDPSLLSQQDLLADLLPRLKSLGTADGLAAKSRKKYARGVREFVDNGRSDRALSAFLDVTRRNPECAKCQTMLALAELDSGDWDGATRQVDAAVQLTTKNKSNTGGSLEAIVLAGVMQSWMHAPPNAAAFLAYAIRREPKNKLALQEIGRAYLQLQEYKEAGAYLKSSVAAGGGQDASILWVQALLKEHKFGEADAEMRRFLRGRKVKKMPLEVRRVWAEVQNGKRVETLYVKTHKGKKRKEERREVVSMDYLHDSPQKMHLKGLEPAKSQDALNGILAATGKEVAALFHDFQDSTSLEKVRQQQLRRNGQVSVESVEEFRYLCLMPADPSVPGFTEQRKSVHSAWRPAGAMKQGYMLTSGFVSAALIFHPAFQSGSEFRYLGRQKIDGQETEVIAFAQIPTKAELVGSFKIGEYSAPTFQQGLAWIDARTHQIVRLRTELLKPLPEARLSRMTTQIAYQEVHFKKLDASLWLPKNVTVTVNWRGRTLRNQHQYSRFRLFNVRAAERIRKPNTSQQVSGGHSVAQ